MLAPTGNSEHDQMEKEFSDHRTKYRQLADMLAERLRSHPAGEKLPSVRSLMRRFKISQHTVMSAFRLLEEEQLISRRNGSGVYRSTSNHAPLIAYCLPDTMSSEIAMREKCLRIACEERGWKLVAHPFDPKRVDIFADEIRADGYVLQPELVTFRSPLLTRLGASRVPCVVFGRDTGGTHLDFCVGDDASIIKEFISGLVKLGHRRLALMVSEPHFHEIEERIKVFTHLCQILDIEYFEILDAKVEYGPDSIEQSDVFLRKYVKLLPRNRLPFTGMITISSSGSIAALRALHDAGFRAPQDYSLCCMGTDTRAPYSIPSITNAFSHHMECAEACMRIIGRRLQNDKTPLLYERVPYQTCWRESSGPAPAPRRPQKLASGEKVSLRGA